MASLRWLQSIKHEATGSSWILSACVKLFIFCGQWARWLTTHHWRKADDFWKDMFLTWTTISNRKTFAHYLLHHTIPHHWSMLNGEITQHAKFSWIQLGKHFERRKKTDQPHFLLPLEHVSTTMALSIGARHKTWYIIWNTTTTMTTKLEPSCRTDQPSNVQPPGLEPRPRCGKNWRGIRGCSVVLNFIERLSSWAGGSLWLIWSLRNTRRRHICVNFNWRRVSFSA